MSSRSYAFRYIYPCTLFWIGSKGHVCPKVQIWLILTPQNAPKFHLYFNNMIYDRSEKITLLLRMSKNIFLSDLSANNSKCIRSNETSLLQVDGYFIICTKTSKCKSKFLLNTPLPVTSNNSQYFFIECIFFKGCSKIVSVGWNQTRGFARMLKFCSRFHIWNLKKNTSTNYVTKGELGKWFKKCYMHSKFRILTPVELFWTFHSIVKLPWTLLN